MKNKINNELIELYRDRLIHILIFDFIPILVVILVGYRLLEGLYKNAVEPLQSYYTILILVALSLLIITIVLGIKLFKNLFSTIKKIKNLTKVKGGEKNGH